jgi:hypothetical protein
MIILQGWACSLRVSARNAAKTLPDRHTEILARDADVTVGKNLQHGFDRKAVCDTIAPLNLPKQSPAGAQPRVRIASGGTFD